MKLESELTAGLWHPMPTELAAVVDRLRILATQPAFAAQRQVAFSRALRPYVEAGSASPLAPLPQEVELANLYVLADFYPEDGQLSLIEQLRDVVTEHIPHEQRQWLDPLKHSSMDLMEIVKEETIEGDVRLTLRSRGNDEQAYVQGEPALGQISVGHVLLTRLVRPPEAAHEAERVIAGCALVLSASDGSALFERAQEYRRSLEIESGAFDMAEWGEFTKRYGHLLMWNYAQARFDALMDAVTQIRYMAPNSGPFLYSLAVYDHHQPTFLREGVSALRGFTPATPTQAGTLQSGRTDQGQAWVYCTPSVIARLTVTPSQLFVECDTAERLEEIKHTLASTFGFALRFRHESVTPPVRHIEEETLAKAEQYQVVVTLEEEAALLRAFAEAAYQEWADRPSFALGGQTPRHAASNPATRAQVIELIRELERTDLSLRRIGRSGFDYTRLRSHIGLPDGET